MAVRRKTSNRLTLIRDCGICGKTITTTADTPWVRQVPRDGKKQAITYYCSSKCYQSSYKHKFDGKAWIRRKEREAKRDISEKNRRYYAAHAEEMRERRRRAYWANHDESLADGRYYREKRRLMTEQKA